MPAVKIVSSGLAIILGQENDVLFSQVTTNMRVSDELYRNALDFVHDRTYAEVHIVRLRQFFHG